MSLNEREDIKEARAWLTEHIRTTKDAEKLAQALGLVYLCFDQTGCRASAVSDTISHFYGPTHWTPAIRKALDILRQRYGRLWNYAGD